MPRKCTQDRMDAGSRQDADVQGKAGQGEATDENGLEDGIETDWFLTDAVQTDRDTYRERDSSQREKLQTGSRQTAR